jgi:hypothetical protein
MPNGWDGGEREWLAVQYNDNEAHGMPKWSRCAER